MFANELTSAVCSYLRRTGNEYHSLRRERISVIEIQHPDERVAAFAGTHRIQRIPKNDTQGRRHTSTATIAVLSSDGEVLPSIGEGDIVIESFSGSGAGGQYRNRHPLCARAKHIPTGTTVVSTRHRSLEQNISAARTELLRRLTSEGMARVARRRNMQRRSQVLSDRSAKQWTWNDQRGEVHDHSSGKRWPLKQIARGMLPPVA